MNHSTYMCGWGWRGGLKLGLCCPSLTMRGYNLMFLLSGAGKFNYQGTKRWIDDQLDTGETSLLADVAFVLCLDSVGQTDNINLHVSKPPREGSPGADLVKVAFVCFIVVL